MAIALEGTRCSRTGTPQHALVALALLLERTPAARYTVQRSSSNF
jgi:hypothetical protein